MRAIVGAARTLGQLYGRATIQGYAPDSKAVIVLAPRKVQATSAPSGANSLPASVVEDLVALTDSWKSTVRTKKAGWRFSGLARTLPRFKAAVSQENILARVGGREESP